ncbi:acyltransferase [Legionella pneumophila serogroup 1]
MYNKLTASQAAYLNFLRGFSAIIVLAGHTLSGISGVISFGKQLPFQSLAVNAFFWLSGFLITYHCITKKPYSFVEYMIDRFCRIYVIYIPVLILSVFLLVEAELASMPKLKEWIANILMIQHTPFNRIFEFLPTIPPLAQISPLWSIAVEWWLYTLFGIAFFFHKSSFATRLIMSLLIIPALLVAGYFTLKEYVALVWFLGSGCAYHFCNINRKYNNHAILMLSLITGAVFLVRFYVLKHSLMNMYDLQLVIPGCIFLYSLLLLLSTNKQNKKIELISTFLAFISYTLYLSHEPIRRVVSTFIEPTNLKRGFLICGVCIACATIIAYLLENKHLVVREWLKNKLLQKNTSNKLAYST